MAFLRCFFFSFLFLWSGGWARSTTGMAAGLTMGMGAATSFRTEAVGKGVTRVVLDSVKEVD